MDTLRKPLFVVAMLLMVAVVLIELGAGAVIGEAAVKTDEMIELMLVQLQEEEDLSDDERREMAERAAGAAEPAPPGQAIPYMALLDGLIVFALGLMMLSLFAPERAHAKVQGIATLIVSLLVLLGAVFLIFLALTLLLIKVGLFTAAPFGTIAYLAIWGFFNRGGASAALALIMTLKLAFAVCLVLAHPRFLQNKGLVLIVLTSLLAGLIISFLHAIVPIFLVSITDTIAAIIVAILAAIWAIFLLIGSIISILKAIF